MPDEPHVVRADIEIDAPLTAVWALLTDLGSYGSWNPFVPECSAPRGLVVGAPLHLGVRFANGARIRVTERIIAIQPPADGRATFGYRYTGASATLGLVRTERHHRLEAMGPDRCRYTSEERFGGWLRRFVPLDGIRQGFLDQADGLKWAAEGGVLPTPNGAGG